MNQEKLIKIAETISKNRFEIADVRSTGRASYFFYFRSRVFTVGVVQVTRNQVQYTLSAFPRWTGSVNDLVLNFEHGNSEDDQMLMLSISTSEFMENLDDDYAHQIYDYVHNSYIGIDDLLRDLGIG